VIVTAYAPSGLTSGTRPVLFGDLSYYWIAREAGLGIEVLRETYAEENAIGLIARAEVDGAPVLPEGFARLVIA
jgi:HK97 family phage major capsid protein